jgi:ATP-dependent Clp protease protease subunit
MFWKLKQDENIKEAELRYNPVIITVNEFNEEAAHKFCTDMAKAQNTGQPIIPIVIDSYGGEVYSLMRMIDAINTSKIPVATIVEGKAMSCGVILASCGSKGQRYIGSNATLMVHDVSSGNWGKNAEIQSGADETKRLNEKIYEILAKNTGKEASWFHKKINKRGRADWFVTPEKAVEIGFSDIIGVPTLIVDMKVDYKFGV